ncbi:unnamed protein product [Parnassius apollo]|uniref:(apollo) hypothetical protein n=1 Tax=Parnassius apollo TaxID=110799 RepID=A0A8S3WQC6_PARAO|nr:unnamed protein product [Parnassius apollo]
MCIGPYKMKPYELFTILGIISLIQSSSAQCNDGESLSFVRWTGVAPERAAPVFMYAASGEEESLTGVCLARCRELEDCAAVVVEYSNGNCHGVNEAFGKMRGDNDVAYFSKVCLKLPLRCKNRWWALESTPGYYLQSDTRGKSLLNFTEQQCYKALLSAEGINQYRSAQWIEPENNLSTFEIVTTGIGNCLLNVENKFTEPESYRVSNYYTFYIESQCDHDYPKRIDRCSYEEYYNQTLKHVDLTTNNITKHECKTACEMEERFVCRGFTWTIKNSGGKSEAPRGLCDLHSEDLVTAGSWLLRRTTGATYYRRVICLNISVDCQGSDMVVTYRPRGVFRGRMYVPGRGEDCGARGMGDTTAVKLNLPLYGGCDVNFAYGISNGPGGVVNRTMAYAIVMIQNNPIIQTAGDRWVRVGCSPGSDSQSFTKVDATVAVKDTGKPSLASESIQAGGASAVFSRHVAPLSMYVVRVQDDATTAVRLGDLLDLHIDTTEGTDGAEIEAYHLVASSRLGDSSVLLLDSRGCPTGQVDFPAFTRTWLDGTQRLSARFRAFRFPNSHVVRFALMVRFCENKCAPPNCSSQPVRAARQSNYTSFWNSPDSGAPGAVRQVVASRGGDGAGARVPLELEMLVGSRDVLSADTLVRADHRAAIPELPAADGALVCVHELLLVALLLAWLAVQIILLLGCCVLVKRYRNLAEMSMQKDYQSFDNVGFETSSTHRRVHWPDQTIDILHTT